MPKRLINPVPELIKGEVWEVREAEKPDQAYVDLQKRQMVVPLDESIKSETLRAHELMHVAISPLDEEFEMLDIVEDRTLQSVEDCRIWTELERVGISAKEVDIAEAERMGMPLMRTVLEIRGADEKMIQMEMARLLLARHNTGSEGWLRELAEKDGYEEAIKVADHVLENYFKPYEGKKMPVQPVIDACEWMHKYFAGLVNPEPQPGDGEDEGKEPDPDGEMTESSGIVGEAVKGAPTTSGPPPAPSEEPKKSKKQVDISPVTHDEQKPMEKLPKVSSKERNELSEADILSEMDDYYTAKSGTMELLTPDLTLRYKPSKGKKKIGTDLGVNPAKLYRATIDQKVFVEKAVRDYGVAIVVDCSGSMGMTDHDIEMLLDECPAATIALYASKQGTNQSGVLKLVVSRKMRLDPAIEGLQGGLGGGNVVDLPAVEWLAQRREDIKIWVCDGGVTGRGDRTLAVDAVRRLTRLVLDNNIRRARSVDQLIAEKKRLMR